MCVLYVPRLACNLFSVRAAAAKGNTVKFGIGFMMEMQGRIQDFQIEGVLRATPTCGRG